MMCYPGNWSQQEDKTNNVSQRHNGRKISSEITVAIMVIMIAKLKEETNLLKVCEGILKTKFELLFTSDLDFL